MPWANGQGTTLQLAVHPDGSAMDAFDWRISIATVAAPGPFSHLAGIDRVLLLLDDVAAVLRVDGRPVPLHRFDQVAFAGEADVALESVTAPARDLNVMTRRSRFRATQRVVDLRRDDLATDRTGLGRWRWLLLVSGVATATDGTRTEQLAPLDLLLLGAEVQVSGPAEAILVEIMDFDGGGLLG